MHHIHTSIVSRHLATRGNNKILGTPPPHTSSSEEILPRLTRRTLAQLRTNKSPFLKVNAKTHPSPLCPLCNIHTHDTHHLFNCTHIVAPGFVDRPRRSDCTASQMDGEAGWWTTIWNIGLPPLARVMGVGRQQQLYIQLFINLMCQNHTMIIQMSTTIMIKFNFKVWIQPLNMIRLHDLNSNLDI